MTRSGIASTVCCCTTATPRRGYSWHIDLLNYNNNIRHNIAQILTGGKWLSIDSKRLQGGNHAVSITCL